MASRILSNGLAILFFDRGTPRVSTVGPAESVLASIEFHDEPLLFRTRVVCCRRGTVDSSLALPKQFHVHPNAAGPIPAVSVRDLRRGNRRLCARAGVPTHLSMGHACPVLLRDSGDPH